MALKEYQIICSLVAITATGDVIKFRAPFTGTIKEIHLWTETANANGDNVFNLNKNGSDLYSSGARPKIATSATLGSKTGLSDAVTFGDLMILQLESIATGGVAPVLIMQIIFDDGVAGGLHGIEKAPSSPPAFNDEFTLGSLDAKWSTGSSGTAPTMNYTSIDSYAEQRSTASGTFFAEQAQAISIGVDFALTAKMSKAIGQGVGLMVASSSGFTSGYWYEADGVNSQFRSIQRSGFTVLNTLALNDHFDMFLHVERKGAGVFSFYYSHNGISWKKIYTHTNNSLVISHLGFYLQSNDSTKVRQGIDWIRRDWLFLE